jgi:hypothetical protein
MSLVSEESDVCFSVISSFLFVSAFPQDEKMRGGGSVNLEYSDKKLANQEQLDKSNDIENAKQEEINTKAEGASVSDNIDNGILKLCFYICVHFHRVG